MRGHVVILQGTAARDRARKLVNLAPDGHIVSVHAPTRSTEQNAKMWAMLSEISAAKPLGRTATPEVWKMLFMHAMGHETRFEMGLQGEPFPVGFRSSHLSRAQMAELIEFIQAYCAEHEIALSDDPVRT